MVAPGLSAPAEDPTVDWPAIPCYSHGVTDLVSFTQIVHDAYAHLYDRAALLDHPLARRLFGATSGSSAERLHRTLIDALEWLRPLGTETHDYAAWRRYRHLQLRYLEGATPERIARELGVSPRQARRDHTQALDELARLLWQRLNPLGPAEPPVLPKRAPNLEAELSKVLASATTTPNRLDDLLRSVVATAGPLARDNCVEISLVVEPDLPLVETNRPVLRELLLTLLAEAVVENPGTTLEIRASRGPDTVDVLLRCNALDPDRRELVTRACLEVTRRLARSQNGVIEPVAIRPGEAAGPAVCLRLAASRAQTLLLVDDNPDVGLLYRRYLADSPFRLVQARSPERALRLARELRPDVVILDVLLPSSDGWEILQALQADSTTAAIPVIISSVLPDHALARSLGVRDFLPKPVTRDALLAVLAHLPRASPDVRCRYSPEASEGTPPRGSLPPG